MLQDKLTWLPLFPLQKVVLYPGMVLPLHIFEERYKLLIQRSLTDRQPFGIVLIHTGQEVGGPAVPHPVGTTAKIVDVEQMPEGQMNIVIVGDDRFRIHDFTHDREPYLMGSVTGWPDPPRDRTPTKSLLAAVGKDFTAYANLVMALIDQPQQAAELKLPSDPVHLSYYVAANLHIEADEKQSLLEIHGPAERLRRELSLLRRERELLERLVRLRFQNQDHEQPWKSSINLN